MTGEARHRIALRQLIDIYYYMYIYIVPTSISSVLTCFDHRGCLGDLVDLAGPVILTDRPSLAHISAVDFWGTCQRAMRELLGFREKSRYDDEITVLFLSFLCMIFWLRRGFWIFRPGVRISSSKIIRWIHLIGEIN